MKKVLSSVMFAKTFALCMCLNIVQRLPQILDENRQAGDTDARLLSREELREMAPALSQEALGAVFCPYECKC